MTMLAKSPLILPFLLGGTVGCSQLALMAPGLTQVTPIRDLQPQQTVYLQGQVSDRAPFIGSGAYQLQDSTDSVWIVTTEALPNPGETVLIRGQVQYSNLTIEDIDLREIYVIQEERLRSQPTPSESTPSPAKPVDELFMPHKSQ
ncbi:MAG: DNA-binding protein [Cyanophyceae cyanobacterium]